MEVMDRLQEGLNMEIQYKGKKRTIGSVLSEMQGDLGAVTVTGGIRLVAGTAKAFWIQKALPKSEETKDGDAQAVEMLFN